MVHKLFDKKTRPATSANEELVPELQKFKIKKLKDRKVYVRFKNKILAADSTEMGSLSSKTRGVTVVFWKND